MTALKLTLHRKPFSQIAAGTKKIEYRGKKPYWKTRIENRDYDEIHFRNGYGSTRPFMRVKYLGYYDDGQYCLHLGKILEIRNYQLNL